MISWRIRRSTEQLYRRLAGLLVFASPLVWAPRSETVSRQQPWAVLGGVEAGETQCRGRREILMLWGSFTFFFELLGEVFEFKLRHSVLKKWAYRNWIWFLALSWIVQPVGHLGVCYPIELGSLSALESLVSRTRGSTRDAVLWTPLTVLWSLWDWLPLWLKRGGSSE